MISEQGGGGDGLEETLLVTLAWLHVHGRQMNIHNEAPVTHLPAKHEKQITHKIIGISIFCASPASVSVSVCAWGYPVLEIAFKFRFFPPCFD